MSERQMKITGGYMKLEETSTEIRQYLERKSILKNPEPQGPVGQHEKV